MHSAEHANTLRESRSLSASRDVRPTAEISAARASPVSASSIDTPTGSTHEDRVAAARERAQRRIAERMAAAGLKPQSDAEETLQQRQERERKEREERVRRAEEEDAKREVERQRRLAEERAPASTAAKSIGKKPPPAPPSRRARTDSASQTDAKKAEEVAKAEQAGREQAIREEQQAREAETKRLE